jgi:hypothetical protein
VCSAPAISATVLAMTTPARDRQPTVLKIGGLSGLVTAVEHMLGFRPTESLVAVALLGPRERMHFVLRLDLPGEEDRSAAVHEVAMRMDAAGADGVMLFVHTAEPPAGNDLPHDDLVSELVRVLPVPVREATLVSSGRLWSYLCFGERCCPPEGRPLETDSADAVAVAAAHALEGRSALPDRDAVLAAVQPVGGIAAAAMSQALDRAGADLVETGVDDFSDLVRTEVDQLASRFDDPRAVITDDEAARVTLALHDVLLRDEMLVRLADDDRALLAMLQAVARRAQPPHDAPVCTCVGWAAYADGNGLLAAAALERALRSEPGYTLARLTLQLLNAQVPPEQLRSCAREIDADVDRLASRRRRR